MKDVEPKWVMLGKKRLQESGREGGKQGKEREKENLVCQIRLPSFERISNWKLRIKSTKCMPEWGRSMDKGRDFFHFSHILALQSQAFQFNLYMDRIYAQCYAILFFTTCCKNYGLLWKVLKPENLDDTTLKANGMHVSHFMYASLKKLGSIKFWKFIISIGIRSA